MSNRYRYKVRIYFDFEMDDWGEEPDKHYAKCEAFHRLEEEIGSCYTPEEVIKELRDVLKAKITVKLIKENDDD